MTTFRSVIALTGLLSAAWLSGCNYHSTSNGGMWSYTGGPQTIASTETVQKRVRMVDRRSGEVFFSIDIPPGKQLTYDFDRGDGDDQVYTPDLLRYEVKEIGDRNGSLSNAMTVPGEASRMVEVYVRQGVQYANQPPEAAALRTDQAADRPDWWTPRGGALPENSSHKIYDN